MNNNDSGETMLTCAISLDWFNDQEISVRKVSYKFATLRLIRNDVRDLYLEVSKEKTPSIKFRLKEIVVHKKFMMEGKASIKFAEDKCMLFMSNAPPAVLILFLKTLFVKITGDKPPAQKGIRDKVRLLASTKFEDISPITNAEVARAQKVAGIVPRSTDTTPSPPQHKKRKLDERAEERSLAPKKLYKPSPLAIVEVKLNDEQEEVLQACLSGKNIFFTGSAGTGKSLLLRKIISALPPDGTVATASTGVAACLIGGVTLHSFAGIGDGEASLKRSFELASRPVVGQSWRRCKRLIIDEISMVDGQFFDKIEAVARHVRRNDKPFGGIQLILCGDFLQLPPITRQGFNSQTVIKKFCFQADAWRKVIQYSYELKTVHRQKDSDFIKILNLIRIGHVNDEISKKLLATSKQKIEANGILATQLCSHTNDANLINEAKLDRLTGEEKIFDAQDSDPSSVNQLDNQVPATRKLVLKIGAQVMLLKNVNIGEGLVNGARGVITKYEDGIPVVRFMNGREYCTKVEKWIIKTPNGGTISRKQIPLKLAWAFSIHKSQGLTLDCVEMSLSKVFEAGQAYVALSRAQSLTNLRVLDFDAKQVWANPDVLQFYKMFRRQLAESFIMLGNKNKKTSNGLKLTKNFMDKPLVNIC